MCRTLCVVYFTFLFIGYVTNAGLIRKHVFCTAMLCLRQRMLFSLLKLLLLFALLVIEMIVVVF